MKEGIHPDYHTITVVMTDGTKYQTRSTWGKDGDTLQLDVDPKTHPAWVGGVNLRKTGQMEKFSNKFAFLDKAGTGAKGAAPAAANKEEKKEEKPAVKAEAAPKKEAKEGKKEAKAAAPKAAAKPAAEEDKKN
jgi:large subunit ribosomal protein L31